MKRLAVENARWAKDRVASHTVEFLGPPNGGEFSKGNGTPAIQKHEGYIPMGPIQLPSSSHTCEFGSPESLSPQVFGGSFTPILTRFYGCLENVYRYIYGRGSFV